ncbi:MAG TPA: hypothetical protein VMW58_09995, partial [Anaerolineae bacterium]|nr:hypothetical protein [Anaerolineae bacterium]
PPLVEGRVFTLDVKDTGSSVWLGPAWAVLCGAVASGGLALDWRSLVSLLLAVILTDAVLGSVWRLASGGRRPWLRKAIGKPGGRLPGSRARRLLAYLRGRPGHWRAAVWPRAGTSMLGLGFLLLLALAIAAALGGAALLLTIGALGVATWRQALISREGSLSAALGSCYLAGLPWLIGWAAFGSFEWARSELIPLAQALGWAAAYALTFHAYRMLGGQRLSTGANLLVAAHVAVVALLIVARQPILAGCVALLLLTQLMLQPALLKLGEGAWYLRRVQVFTMLAMMVAAVAMVA